ncbi:MAG: hypothetical protein ACM3O4_00335 [Ignavibacteriales bacterium]
MKGKVFFIIVSVSIMIGAIFYISFHINNHSYKTFYKNGYILTASNDTNYQKNDTVKFYFEADAKYKVKYPEKIVFSDIDGNKIVADSNAFVHYLDGSISVLKKGVIMDLNNLNSEFLKYYNIFDDALLENNNGIYSVDNLGKKIKFNDFILKTSDSKYLIVSKSLKLKINGKDDININNYIELNFTDGNITKLDNQEVSYQTISSDSSIEIGDKIKLNLEDKSISVGENKTLTLSQMVIDSDENIQITPPKPEEGGEADDKGGNDNGTGGNTGEDNTDNGDTIGEVVEDDGQNDIIPSFLVSNLDITSNKMDASIQIVDTEGKLSSNIITKIIENGSGKTVYMKEDDTGSYNLNVVLENLKPETNYTLITTATYTQEDVEYTKDFISKAFRTESIGISYVKDYFTKNELSFTVKSEAFSKVEKAEMVLLTSYGDLLKTIEIDGALAKSPEGVNVLFDSLTPNTKYVVKLMNFLYDGSVILNEYEMTTNCSTLKNKPTLGLTSFIIDKKNGLFTLKVNNVSDIDNGISSYRYEVYDARNLESGDNKPLFVIEKDKLSSIDLLVDEVSVFRGVPYVFKLIAEFYDNEKYIEYESEYSDVFKMDGVEFPTIRFEPTNVTFERISGTILITDKGNTIRLDENVMTVVYSDSTGNTNSFTSAGNLAIPISVNNLRANETYTISLYATINLQDGNPTVDNCFIGSVVVKTKETKEFVVNYNVDNTSVLNAFTVLTNLGTESGIDNTLEAGTLTGITFNLYAGQSTNGTLVKTVKKVDRNLAFYDSDLKNDYYDKSFAITPEFFGAKNSDITDAYYTIEVVNAYDYTNYKNNIPIRNKTITVKTNGFVPDLPPDYNTAIEVLPIRNKDAGDRYRAELLPETIIGYRVKAGYDNSKQYVKYLKYYVYNADTGQSLIPEGVKVDVLTNIEYTEFYLNDGTPYEIIDSELRRGNNYYFAYEAYLDLNFDGMAETKYPYDDANGNSIILRSSTISPNKQPAKFQLYPSTSDDTTMTWKYRYVDIDNSLLYQGFEPKIGTSSKTIQNIQQTLDNLVFNSVTFTSLSKGLFSINVTEALIKTTDNVQKKKLASLYFDGLYTLPNLQFHTELDVNRVIISILDYETNIDAIKKIAALKVTFDSGGQTIVKDYVPLENDSVIIDLSEISQFINQQITVSVEAYYDSGITGFETTKDLVALHTATDSPSNREYLTINQQNNFRGDFGTAGSIYTRTFTPTLITIKNLITNYTKSIPVSSATCDEGGISYNYEYLTFKQLETKALASNGTNVIQFNYIVPGVSLLNALGKLDISPTLRYADVMIELYGINASDIQNDLIYLELYQTDDTGIESTFVREMTFPVSALTKPINIPDLYPKSQYYFKLFAYIYDGTNYIKQQLYDIDFKSSTKLYYFSTLSNIGISNVQTKYSAVTYSNKFIDITYDLEQIIGYDKIKYELYKYVYNETTSLFEKVPVDIEISDDLIFTNKMTKRINCPPGSDFTFDTNYNLVITPYAYVQIPLYGQQYEIELGNKISQDFYLDRLRAPFVGITSTSTDDIGLEFKINIFDISKTIVNGTYTVKILDNNNLDVTPEQYKNVEYSILNLNNTIKLSQLQRAKEYTLIVTTYVDYSNNITDSQKVDTLYKASTLDDSGIDIGNVYSTMNPISRSKIDLSFYNSYKLTYITNIRYSIYNASGYAQDNEIPFIPTQYLNDDGLYYLITLPENLPSSGIYYIEIQFLNNNTVIKTASLEHNYTS